MTSFLDMVRSRRSIRAYTGRDIKREDLELCVEAARYAPSACNSQPWKFIIVDDRRIKDAVAKRSLSGLYAMNAFAEEAAAFIIIVSESTELPAWLGKKFRSTDFRRMDIGSACEHVVLQAQELGIGTCILGWFDEGRLKKLLSVPRSKKIELVIALGYPADTKLPEKRLKEKDEVVSFNKY